jgi:hypothetical protein
MFEIKSILLSQGHILQEAAHTTKSPPEYSQLVAAFFGLQIQLLQ